MRIRSRHDEVHLGKQIFKGGVVVEKSYENPLSQHAYGKNFYVNKLYGDNGKTGKSPSEAKASIVNALALVVSGRGDNIFVNSSGATAADGSDYLGAALTISQWGTKIIGDPSPVMSPWTAIGAADGTALANVITISGSNNVFANLRFIQEDDTATSVGCVTVTGNRNFFYNCHFQGGGHATPAGEAGMFSLKLDGADDNVFDNCIIGNESILRAAANAELLFDGACKRNVFRNCIITSKSDTAGKFLMKLADASGVASFTVFENCLFYNLHTTTPLTNAISFAGSETQMDIFLRNCLLKGAAEWDSTDSGKIWVDGTMTAATAEDAGLAVEPVNT